jgi:hypothetical protein
MTNVAWKARAREEAERTAAVAQQVQADREAEAHAWAAFQAMRQHVQHAEQQARIDRALEKWHDERRVSFGMSTIDTLHVCSRECQSSGAIQVIDAELRLYGCLRSGAHHVCDSLRAMCKIYYLNDHGEYFCTFSCISLGVSVSRSLYDGPEAEHDGVMGGDDGGYDLQSEPDEDCDGDAGLGYDDVLHHDWEAETSAASAAASARKRRNDGDSAYGMRLIVPPPPAPPPVVVVSTTVVTDGSSSRTKHASGQFVGEDGRPASLSLAERRRKLIQPAAQIQIYDIVRAIMTSNERRRISEVQTSRRHTDTSKEMTLFYDKARRDRVRPNVHDRDAIFDMCVARNRSIGVASLTSQDLTRYSAVVFETWRVIVNSTFFETSSANFDLLRHTLGTLYLLASDQGIVMDDPDDEFACVEVLPRDAALEAMLPAQNALSAWQTFNFSKRAITRGRFTLKSGLEALVGEAERADAMLRIRQAYEFGTVRPIFE